MKWKFSEATIPNAHVTSYKPKVYWKDDGFEDVIYTLPPSRGGIGLVISEISEPNPKGPAPMAKTTTPPSDQWTVTDVDSDFIDALQVYGTMSFIYLEQ